MRTHWKWLLLLVLVLGVMTACNSDDDDQATPPPEDLMAQAADSLDKATSFRLIIRPQGAAVVINTGLIEEGIELNKAEARFASPDKVRASVSVRIDAVTQEVQVVAISDRQYIQLPILTGDNWLVQDFAAGFMPEDLQSDENGIGAALRAMQDMEYVGTDEVSGIPVYHIRGMVPAAKIRSVTVGLIGTQEGLVKTDVYIRRDDTNRVARIVVEEPAANEESEVTIWTIELDSYNQDVTITEPEVN